MASVAIDWSSHYADRAARIRASEIRELLKLLDSPSVISFAGGIPDPALFPGTAIAAAHKAVLEEPEIRLRALQYSVSEGYPPLKQWIAGYMAGLGVPCGPEHILITNGSQQALDFLGRLFLSPGDKALVTAPTYLGALQAFDAYEASYDTLSLGAAGNGAEVIGGGNAKFAYVVPDFSNPTGVTLDLAQRRRLLALLDELTLPVIEDAAYTSLRYDGESLPSLLALEVARRGSIDATRVIFCGTFSKTLAPGFRVGWICAARPLIDKLTLIKQASDLHSSTINQMIMHRVAESSFDDQVARVRRTYRERRDAMLAALAREMPDGVSWSRPEGGMFVWLELPDGLDGRRLLQRGIAEADIAFVPGNAFFAKGGGENTLRLSFSLVDPARIEDGVARLGRLLRQT